MKVYELISELSKLPAGAEVEFATIMTIDEFTQCEIVDDFDGKVTYRVAGIIQEVERINDNLIALYK